MTTLSLAPGFGTKWLRQTTVDLLGADGQYLDRRVVVGNGQRCFADDLVAQLHGRSSNASQLFVERRAVLQGQPAHRAHRVVLAARAAGCWRRPDASRAGCPSSSPYPTPCAPAPRCRWSGRRSKGPGPGQLTARAAGRLRPAGTICACWFLLAFGNARLPAAAGGTRSIASVGDAAPSRSAVTAERVRSPKIARADPHQSLHPLRWQLRDPRTCPSTTCPAGYRRRPGDPCSSRSARNCARCCTGSAVGLRYRHQSAQRETAATRLPRGRALRALRARHRSCSPPHRVDLQADLQRLRTRGTGLAEPLGDLQAIDAVHPAEVLGDGASLVALDRTDEMPLDRQSWSCCILSSASWT